MKILLEVDNFQDGNQFLCNLSNLYFSNKSIIIEIKNEKKEAYFCGIQKVDTEISGRTKAYYELRTKE